MLFSSAIIATRVVQITIHPSDLDLAAGGYILERERKPRSGSRNAEEARTEEILAKAVNFDGRYWARTSDPHLVEF
jgi:hypothetical protein